MRPNLNMMPSLRFALAMSKLSALFGLSTFIFTLAIGVELQSSTKASTGLNRSVGTALVVLVSSFALIVLERFTTKAIGHLVCLLVLVIASVWTWPGSTFTGVTVVTLCTWTYIVLRLGVRKYESIQVEHMVKERTKKKSSFSSNSKIEPNIMTQPLTYFKEYATIVVIIVINIAAFTVKWHQFADISIALALARGGAATINANLGLLALPTLHRLWALLTRLTLNENRRPVHTKSIFLHRTLAILVLLGSFVHIQGHNAFIATRKGEIYLLSAWITGSFLTAIIFSIYVWSNIKSSRKRFEQIHLCGGIFGTVVLFSHGPSSIFWCLPGIILTCVERALASRPASKEMTLLRSERFGKSVLHVQFDGKLKIFGGEYVYVNLPGLSVTDWRPFSAIPEINPPGFSLFIRVRPESTSWTNRLQQHLLTVTAAKETVKVLVDGPHPSPTSQYVKYPRIVLAATGVGCTPVVSVLRRIRQSRPATLTHVTVAWIVPLREVNDFEWMLQEIHEACVWSQNSTEQVQVRVHVYITGCVPGSSDSAKPPEVVEGEIWSSTETLKRAVCNPVAPSVLQCASFRPRPWMLVEVWRGRPFFCSLLRGEKQTAADEQYQFKIGVFCCGPPPFVRDVRGAIKTVMRTSDKSKQQDENELEVINDEDDNVFSDPSDQGSSAQEGSSERISFAFHREVF